MAQSSSHAETLRTFGKFLREEKNKVDKEYVNKIIPVLSEIKYTDYTMEEIQDLIESIKEVLEHVDTHKGVSAIEIELHKASTELERAKNELLIQKSKASIIRRDSGRKVLSAQNNDSGCYSADSKLFTDSRLVTERESMFVTHPEDSEDGDITTSQTSRPVCLSVNEPIQNEDTSKTMHVVGDSNC